jgi:hypothetical protein
MRFQVRALGFVAMAGALVAASCGNGSNGSSPSAGCTAIGHECRNDSDCCTSYCMLEGTKAYCQNKPAVDPPCIDVGGNCTENRHCCSLYCVNDACAGGPVGTQCVHVGNPCSKSDDCCTQVCTPAQAGSVCTFSGGVDAGCGLPGDSCTTADQCCSLSCSGNVCGGAHDAGAGNCYPTGWQCQTDNDCCSHTCATTATINQCK